MKSLIIALIFVATVQCSLYDISKYASLDEVQFRLFPSFDSVELHCSALRLKNGEKVKTTLNGADIATDEIIDMHAGKYECELEASKATLTLESGFEKLTRLDIVEIAFSAKGADGHPTIEFESVNLNLINKCYKDTREMSVLYSNMLASIETKGFIARDEASGSYVCRIDEETVLKFSYERIDFIPRITSYAVKLTGVENFVSLAVACSIKEFPGFEKSGLEMRIWRDDWRSAAYSEGASSVYYDPQYLALPYTYKCTAKNKYGSDVVAFRVRDKDVTPVKTGELLEFHANLNAGAFILDHYVPTVKEFGQKLKQNGREVQKYLEIYGDLNNPSSKRFAQDLELMNEFSYDYIPGKKFDFEFIVKGFSPKVTTFNLEYRPTKHLKPTCDASNKILPYETSMYFNDEPLKLYKPDGGERAHVSLDLENSPKYKSGTYKCRVESENGFDEVIFTVKEEADHRPNGSHHYNDALGGKTSSRVEFYLLEDFYEYFYKHEVKPGDYCIPNAKKRYKDTKTATRESAAPFKYEVADFVCFPMNQTRFIYDFSRPNYSL